MYITYGKVFGRTLNILMLLIFPENASILERIVNRALIVYTNLFKFCINKKILIFIFAMYQNYPMALTYWLNLNESPWIQRHMEGFVIKWSHEVIMRDKQCNKLKHLKHLRGGGWRGRVTPLLSPRIRFALTDITYKALICSQGPWRDPSGVGWGSLLSAGVSVCVYVGGGG